MSYYGQCAGYHERYWQSTYNPQTHDNEYYVKVVDATKARYHARFGFPADIDLVWAYRGEYQDMKDGQRK